MLNVQPGGREGGGGKGHYRLHTSPTLCANIYSRRSQARARVALLRKALAPRAFYRVLGYGEEGPRVLGRRVGTRSKENFFGQPTRAQVRSSLCVAQRRPRGAVGLLGVAREEPPVAPNPLGFVRHAALARHGARHHKTNNTRATRRNKLLVFFKTCRWLHGRVPKFYSFNAQTRRVGAPFS